MLEFHFLSNQKSTYLSRNIYNKQSKETEAPLILECALNTSATKCIGMENGTSQNHSMFRHEEVEEKEKNNETRLAM